MAHWNVRGREGKKAAAAVLTVLLWMAADPARAGVPFVTDDAGTPPEGGFEIDMALQYAKIDGEKAWSLPSLDVNYGATDAVQLHLLVSASVVHQTGDGTRFGYGDTEVGVKYRFLDEDEEGWRPSVALFPLIELPTGDETVGLGNGHVAAFLPLWVSKELGPWSLFGGGGYWVNPGEGHEDFWFVGMGAKRRITDALSLGAEIFHETKDATDGKDNVSFNLGAVYDFSEIHHLLISAGQGLHNRPQTNEFSAYVAYQLTF
ncbi:MAG: transporter [Alphaproteobacteria bacterium]